jgi:thiosulfate dehydrogenase (quinone) large subunit
VTTDALSGRQQAALVVLRTLIGWHFLYEGFYKAMLPGWSREGVPLAGWSSAGYLKAATGPFAGLFKGLAGSSWLDKVDLLVIAGLLVVGLSLMLGLFTQAGCAGALLLLAVFYLSAIPLHGLPQPHTEGAYLIVNKNLVEAAAVLVLLSFRTGRIAGLDLLRAARGPRELARTEAVAS